MDDDEFKSAMEGVKPIKAEKRVSLNLQGTIPPEIAALRRRSAETVTAKSDDPLAGDDVELLDPFAVLDFRRSGVQHGVYKQLRLGRYNIDARLDLHRMTIEESRRSVYQFIRDCMRNDIRCALITHGKGEGRKKPAVLKSHVAYWLPQIKEVLAFHSAQPQHGGLGACYVMLKKSEAKRQDNLERHQRR